MTDTPPDWVLIEAAKRIGWNLDTWSIDAFREQYRSYIEYRVICDMIQKYEHPPVDRKLLCAREAVSGTILYGDLSFPEVEANRKAMHEMCIRAIELWVEGYGE